MDIRLRLISGFTMVLALGCLAVSLIDLARLLGVTTGGANPVTSFGMVPFVFMAAFALGKMFAAVGLWIQSSWGAALLALTAGIELLVGLMGLGGISLAFNAFLTCVLLLIGAAILLAIAQIKAMDLLHD